MDTYTMEELRALREEIRSAKTDGLTVGELKDRLERLSDTERRIAAMEQVSGYARRDPAGYGGAQAGPYANAAGAGQARGRAYVDLHRNAFRRTGRNDKRKAAAEQAVGRYAMTVLAAALCLLALAVFVMSFWQAMPDPVKFALFILLGAGLEAAGFIRSGKGSMRAFWLGVAGLGAGASFIDIAAGCLAWNLYGIILAGILIMAWVLANFWLGRKQSCGMFYMIAYIGGLLAIWIGKLTAYGDAGETVLIALSAAVIASGTAEYYKEKKPYLMLFDIIFCLAAGNVLRQPVYSITLNTYVPGAAISWYCFLLGGFCLYQIRSIKFRSKFFKRLGPVPQAAMAFVCCMYAGTAAGRLELPGAWGLALAALLIAATGFGSAEGYLLGASLPMALVLQELSTGLGLAEAFLASAAACAACAMYHKLKYKPDRLAAWILYVMALLLCMRAEDGRMATCYCAAAFLGTGLAMYQMQCRTMGLYTCEPLENLVSCAVPGILCTVFAEAGLVPDILPVAVISAGLQAYWIVYLKKAEPSAYLDAARFLWYVMRAAAYAGVLASAIFADGATKAVLAVSLMLTLAFNVYKAIGSESRIQSAAACLMANWHLHLLAGIYGFGSYQVAISLTGMAVSAGSVMAGFVLDKKGMRQAGLGCVILYALKLGLIDASGGGLGTAGGLLLAGIICFGVSLAYNKLGKIYGRQDGRE